MNHDTEMLSVARKSVESPEVSSCLSLQLQLVSLVCRYRVKGLYVCNDIGKKINTELLVSLITAMNEISK